MLQILKIQKYKFLFGFLLLLISTPVLSQQDRTLPADKQSKIDEYIQASGESEKSGDYKKAASFLTKSAIISWKNGAPNKALQFFQKAINLHEKINNLNDIKAIYSNMGVISTEIEDVDKAIDYFNKSLQIRRKIGKTDDIASGIIDLAYVLQLSKKYDKAIANLKEALPLAQSIKNDNLVLNCYNALSKCYENLNNQKLAAEFSDKYKTYHSQIENESKENVVKQKEVEKKIEIQKIETEKQKKEKELNTEINQKEKAIDTLKERTDSLSILQRNQKLAIDLLNKDKVLQETKLREQDAIQKRQRTFIISLIVGAFLSIVVIFLVIRNSFQRRRAMKQLASQNQEIILQKNDIDAKNEELNVALSKIEKQNKEINASINYASRIQQAILEPVDKLQNFLPESFILFRPKDVVSGDYYWFNQIINIPDSNDNESIEEIQSKIRRNTIISAIDCTGHGVPGALLSMIANNLLYQIVVKDQVIEANLILDELNNGVRKILKQDVTKSRDGMDMSICIVKEDDGVVEYAGARSPLVYIKNNELMHIKGDIQGIGGLQVSNERRYTSYKIEIDTDTQFYIFSDGFADQFGGDKQKKLMSARFRDVLFETHNYNMADQRQQISDFFDHWKGNYEQVDDVLVIGFKVPKLKSSYDNLIIQDL